MSGACAQCVLLLCCARTRRQCLIPVLQQLGLARVPWARRTQSFQNLICSACSSPTNLRFRRLIVTSRIADQPVCSSYVSPLDWPQPCFTCIMWKWSKNRAQFISRCSHLIYAYIDSPSTPVFYTFSAVWLLCTFPVVLLHFTSSPASTLLFVFTRFFILR